MGDSIERLRTGLTDRYLVEREIGRGGMATVYLAHDQKHDRHVAIKVLHPEVGGVLGGDRFLREIRISAGLTHPNILPLHDSGEIDGLFYYVMPYVEGESLRARLDRESQLPVEDALDIAREVAEALAEAHARGIVHRDIKPENILLVRGHAVVADFGIARALTVAGSDRLTATGLVVGTPTYMSPEQTSGSEDVDGRSDLYALGCVLYEMLTGGPPFTKSRAQSVAFQHLMAPVAPPSSIRPAVGGEIDGIVSRALAKNPDDRFPSATDMSSALREVGGRASRSAPTIAAGSRRDWRRPVVAGLGVTVLLGVAAWSLTRDREPTPALVRRLAVVPLANLTGDLSQEYFVAGMHDALIGELARVPGLTVISRQSVLRYQRSEQPIPAIARELGVDAVIQGSVFRAGDSVRISVQLVRASPESHLWSDSYNRELRSALAIHGEVARAVAEAVHATLTPEVTSHLAKTHLASPAAQDAYLRGMYYVEQQALGTLTPVERGQTLRLGIAKLEEATTLDPGWSTAHAKLANAYHWLASQDSTTADTLYPKAKASALRSRAIDANEAQAHASLAFVLFRHERDWVGAEQSMRRAMMLNPSETHWIYSVFLFEAGRYDDAIVQLRAAEERNPLSGIIKAQLARSHYCAGHDSVAIPQLTEVLQHWPTHSFPEKSKLALLAAFLRRGMNDSARAVAHRAVAANPGNAGDLSRLAYVHARTGASDSARAILSRLEREAAGAVTPELYVALGQPERAMDVIEAAARRRSTWFGMFPCWPERTALRDNPRFREIERRFRHGPWA